MLTLMSLGAGEAFSIVLDRDEGFGLLYLHQSVIGGGLFWVGDVTLSKAPFSESNSQEGPHYEQPILLAS